MAHGTTTQSSAIDSVLHEQRLFPPPPEFSKRAHIKSVEEYERIYKELGITADRVVEAALRVSAA